MSLNFAAWSFSHPSWWYCLGCSNSGYIDSPLSESSLNCSWMKSFAQFGKIPPALFGCCSIVDPFGTWSCCISSARAVIFSCRWPCAAHSWTSDSGIYWPASCFERTCGLAAEGGFECLADRLTNEWMVLRGWWDCLLKSSGWRTL